MIRKYIFGKPLETEAVVAKMEAAEGGLPYFEEYAEICDLSGTKEIEQSILVNLSEEELAIAEAVQNTQGFRYVLGKQDVVYGLGENIRGINKRGWYYVSYADDNPHHHEDVHRLYGAHNFFIVDGRERFGVFIDYPGEIKFDIGYTHKDEFRILPEDRNLIIYIIEGDSLKDIVKQFRQMIGRSYMAPRWALGYGQSRWGYENEADIREVAEKYRRNHLPLDMIYVDIDYMDGYRNFTIDKEAYPDFEELVKDMKAANIHLVPIIDAGVKAEAGYYIDEEGLKNGYFCKCADGTEFVGTVWPGECHFPDFLKPEVRKWFGEHYGFLLEKGIDGFWNDMNEPAIFYSKAQMQEMKQYIKTLFEDRIPTDAEIDGLAGKIQAMKNSRKDYESFYHEVNGERVRHDKIHNLYGYNMTRAAGEAFERLCPEERILMFSRSSYTGMHRYGGIWTGDNYSWWSHLKMNLSMLPGLNMQGFLYSGADLGGFGSDVTEDLLLRWLELGIFTPLMRNHSAKGTREQEVYRFSDIDAFRRVLSIRYALLPYIYSEYMKACLRDEMLFRPLGFDYEDDKHAAKVEDQLMFGDSLMIAPVLEQNATGRYVYLPEDMKLIRFRSAVDYEEEVLTKGHHYVEVPLDEVVVFLKPDKLIVLSDGGEFVEEVEFEKVKTISYVKTEATYEYYHDNGYSRDCEKPEYFTILREK
ncbi:MAG: alpha-glucosidase [Lachnospiraceae bacterium]|nr:alpha-glucosidase [Lachnospiraceae bacterium]